MSDEKTQKLLQGAIKAARGGQPDLARKAFLQVLKLEPENEAAWLGLATVTDDASDKVRILRKILDINPANDKAQEALRRLGVTEKPEMASAESIQAELDAEAALSEPDFESEFIPEDEFMPEPEFIPIPEPEAEDFDDFELPPLEILPAEDELAPEQRGGLRSLKSLRSDEMEESETPESTFSEAEPLRQVTYIPKSSEEIFAIVPAAPPGYEGIPIANPQRVRVLSQEVQDDVNAYLQTALADYENVRWEQKKRGRAGQGEYVRFIFASGLVAVLIFSAISAAAVFGVLNDPAMRRILLAPTWTLSPTATVTPTATPGLTNTPSPTPRQTLTPSPTLRPTITPGNPDPNFPLPTATTYFSPGIQVDVRVREAIALIDEGRLTEAFAILQEEKEATSSTGDFSPYYYLTLLYLQQNQVNQAQTNLDEYMNVWGESNRIENYRPLMNLAQARVALYRAEQANRNNNTELRNQNLTTAETLFTEVIEQYDPRHPDAYFWLTEAYLLRGNNRQALDTINSALNSAEHQEFYANLELRLERVKVYRIQRDFDRALQDLHDILTINPFHESALIQQAQVALESGQAGLGVLYSQQYLLYYPGSVEGYLLLGRARAAEDKYDLALNAFSRGLLGDSNATAFGQILIERASLYITQKNYTAAEADLARAASLGRDNNRVRLLRLQAAFATENYAQVVSNAQELIGSGVLPDNQLRLYLGQAQVERGNYQGGLENLTQVLSGNLGAAFRPIAFEYIALAQLNLGEIEAALEAIQSALNLEESASRRFVRAQIYEALVQAGEQPAINRWNAINDYEFVITWGTFYRFSFLGQAEQRYNALLRQVNSR